VRYLNEPDEFIDKLKEEIQGMKKMTFDSIIDDKESYVPLQEKQTDDVLVGLEEYLQIRDNREPDAFNLAEVCMKVALKAPADFKVSHQIRARRISEPNAPKSGPSKSSAAKAGRSHGRCRSCTIVTTTAAIPAQKIPNEPVESHSQTEVHASLPATS
jgi:hypothetical protein